MGTSCFFNDCAVSKFVRDLCECGAQLLTVLHCWVRPSTNINNKKLLFLSVPPTHQLSLARCVKRTNISSNKRDCVCLTGSVPFRSSCGSDNTVPPDYATVLRLNRCAQSLNGSFCIFQVNVIGLLSFYEAISTFRSPFNTNSIKTCKNRWINLIILFFLYFLMFTSPEIIKIS